MKIKSIKLMSNIYGLDQIYMKNLEDIVILAGSNGSGKSRILKIIENYINLKNKKEKNEPISDFEQNFLASIEFEFEFGNISNAEIVELTENEEIFVINYSHYDATLQLPKNYTPYVISKSIQNLEKCDFEGTVRDSLLFLNYLTKYADNVIFEDFKVFIKELANLEFTKDENNSPLLFGLNINNANLSPGQTYLLRMCSALYCNKIKVNKFILLLDEPETHLHPDALLKILNKIIQKFNCGQIWIATHSVAILSMFNPNQIWHCKSGDVKKMGSKSDSLIKSLIGDEENRFNFHQFVVSPDNFACNEFATECLVSPISLGYINNDPQVQLITELIRAKDSITVVDYGAGKGRLLESINSEFNEIIKDINYCAYDISPIDADECKKVMKNCHISVDNYFNETSTLSSELGKNGKADYVFMVNVLHEIPPDYWGNVFKGIISLLKGKGELIIIENEEFTYGEKAYDNGFLVLQSDAVKSVLGDSIIFERHKNKQNIVRYRIKCDLLNIITEEKITDLICKINEKSLEKIREIKQKQISVSKDFKDKFQLGIRLAFWTHQFTNSSLILIDRKKIKIGD